MQDKLEEEYSVISEVLAITTTHHIRMSPKFILDNIKEGQFYTQYLTLFPPSTNKGEQVSG